MKKLLIWILIIAFIVSGARYVKNNFFKDGFFDNKTIMTIKYQSEGEPTKTVKLESFDEFELLVPEERERQTFLRWYFDEDFRKVATIPKIMEIEEKEVTLYARWTRVEYIIEFKNLVKKESSGSMVEEYEEILLGEDFFYFGELLDFRAFYEGDEKQVVSWNFKDGTKVQFPVFIKEDLVLYAVWGEPDRTIEYHLDGGTNNDKNPFVFNSEIDYEIILFQPTKEDNKYVGKEDFDFVGWKNKADDEFIETIKTFGAESVELYAVWKYNIIFIEFDGKGGGVFPYDGRFGIDFNKKDTFEIPKASRIGYKFLGWSKFVGGDIIDTITIDNYKDIDTLFANWEFIDVEIPLYLDGGQSEQKSVIVNLDKGSEYDLLTPTKEGFEFSHWEDQYGYVYEKITKNNYRYIEYLIANWIPVP